MKRIVLIAALAGVCAMPSFAEEKSADDGVSLMEKGAELFLEGIRREMAPALDDLRGMADDIEPALRDFAREMGPAFADLLGKIEDFSSYHPPELLPNGDIILRKKQPQEPAPEADGDIEL